MDGSGRSSLAWFDEIVPAYWPVASDVKEARRPLNFSEIGKLPSAQQKAALYEALNLIQLGAMPLPEYTRLYREAAVTPAQLSEVKNYLNPPEAPSAALASDLAAVDENWIREDSSTHAVAPAPIGIEFPSDYKNWKAISATDRSDNRTMRVILGNNTAVNAIAENHIHPWPDGTTFAKVASFARDNGQGHVRWERSSRSNS